MTTITKNKKVKAKKIFLYVIATLVAITLAIGTAVYSVWGNEISTLASIKLLKERNDEHLDGDVYTINVKGDFYLDEFIAQGGVKNDAELIEFITKNLTKGLVDLNVSTPNIGCASFTAKAENGDMLFGRNYDFSKTNTAIVFTEANKGRYATISSVDLQFMGIDVDTGIKTLRDKIIALAAPYATIDGINEAGLSCGIYMTYQGEETISTDQNTDKPDITSTTLLRLILDYASTVEEAVEIASTYDLHDSANTSFHYMVADASGKSAILEWINSTDITDNDGSARQLKVTYNDNDSHIGENEGASDFQWVTNFIIEPGYYDDTDIENKKGLDRYEKLYEELSKSNGIVKDEQAAMDILASIGRRSWKNDDGNGCTVHSVVYNLTEKTVMWVPNEHYSDENSVFTFKLD